MANAFKHKGNHVHSTGILAQLQPPPPYIMEDFLMDVLADSPFVSVTQSGTPTAAAAVSATAGDPVASYGGWVAGATDDVDAEIDEVAVGGLSTGAGNPWMRADRLGSGVIVVEWAMSIPTALTARQYFAGISDDPVEGTGTNGSLNIAATTVITDVANDAGGWIFSSLATAPTFWKFGATDSGTQDTATDGPLAVLDTWVGLRTEVDVNGDCYFSQRNVRGGTVTQYGKSANGLSPDVPLLPVFTAAPTTTTAVPWEIDYCYAVQANLP